MPRGPSPIDPAGWLACARCVFMCGVCVCMCVGNPCVCECYVLKLCLTHLYLRIQQSFLLGNVRKYIQEGREADMIKVQEDLASGAVIKGGWVVCLPWRRFQGGESTHQPRGRVPTGVPLALQPHLLPGLSLLTHSPPAPTLLLPRSRSHASSRSHSPPAPTLLPRPLSSDLASFPSTVTRSPLLAHGLQDGVNFRL